MGVAPQEGLVEQVTNVEPGTNTSDRCSDGQGGGSGSGSLLKKEGYRTFREGYRENEKCLGTSGQST